MVFLVLPANRDRGGNKDKSVDLFAIMAALYLRYSIVQYFRQLGGFLFNMM